MPLYPAPRPPKIFTAKFGSEGATTTSTAYVTIADSDICIDSSLFMHGGNLWARFYYHLHESLSGGTASIIVYRQNADSTIPATEKSVTGTGWAKLDTGWLDWSNEGSALLGGTWGPESYQLQMKTTSGGTAEFNSAIMILSHKKF